MVDDLTLKQRQFVVELCNNGFNATKAAENAGYSEKTAYAQGSRLLKNVKIQKGIDNRLKSRGITKEKISRELDLIGFSSIGDVLRIEGGHIFIKDSADIEPHHLRLIKSIQETKEGLKVTLYSKERALEILSKITGAIDESPNINLNLSYAEAKKIHQDVNGPK